MQTLTSKISAGLTDYVQCIYSNYSDDITIREASVPQFGIEVFYSFGDYFKFGSLEMGAESNTKMGILTTEMQPKWVTSRGRHYTTGIIFEPWALHLIENISGKNLSKTETGHTIEIIRLEFLKIQAQVATLKPEDAIAFLHDFIAKNVSFKEPDRGVIQFLQTSDYEGEFKVKDLASDLGVSHKTLISRFKNHIGETPKRYLQLKTVIEAYLLIRDTDMSLSRIALEAGFFDQSHFIRVFKEVTHKTPSEIRKMSRG